MKSLTNQRSWARWLLVFAGLFALGYLPTRSIAQSIPGLNRIQPNWIDNDRFWYDNGARESDGNRFVLVDATKRSREPVFDLERLRKAYQESESAKLPRIRSLEFASPQRVSLITVKSTIHVNLESYEIEVERREAFVGLRLVQGKRRSQSNGKETELVIENQRKEPIELFWVDMGGAEKNYGRIEPGKERAQHTYAGHVWLIKIANGESLGMIAAPRNAGRLVVDGTPALPAKPSRSVNASQRKDRGRRVRARGASSPDGKFRVKVVDNNLCLLENEGGDQKADLIRLSTDASEGNTFRRDTSRARGIEMQYNLPPAAEDVADVRWAPGSQSLIAFQTKLAPERLFKIVRATSMRGMQPEVISYPYWKAGDAISQATVRLFNVANQSEVKVSNDLFANPFSLRFERWSRDGKKCYLAYNERGHQTLRLIEVDAETGATRAVIEESSDTFIHYSGKYELHWLSDEEVVWMSERDGWNHLYLIDVAAGEVKAQITNGSWNVRRVLRYDTEARTVFFEAVGVADGQSPYHVHLCRVGFDGDDFVQLTRGDGTHEIQWSPDRTRFIDRWSRVDLPPVSVLRDSKTGELICELARADSEKVIARNGPYPERFVAKGRDGKTDIWGIIHRPRNFDPTKKYPVIESIYAGPHDQHVPIAYGNRHGARRFVEQGFIVVQIDGMGTAWRSKSA